jgi:hypothetical protein
MFYKNHPMSKYLYLSLLFCLSFQTVFSSTTPAARAKETGPAFYRDADGDGYGNPSEPATDYENLDGYVSNSDDCDDNNNGINPTATEVCDGFDNNCDGTIDEGVTYTYYRDFDGDGYGDPNTYEDHCSMPFGFVENSNDCNDNFYEINPNTTWYEDLDGDGYGNGNSFAQCDQPGNSFLQSQLIAIEGDCNDNDNTVFPGQNEVCDDIDNNCDGNIDEYVKTTYYRDADGDGFGDPYTTEEFCNPVGGYVDNTDDCNDSNADINPNTIWYRDADGDGFSDGNTIQQCSQPEGYRFSNVLYQLNGDCNDEDNNINPNASEICDGIDNNCDGETDEGVLTMYYYDSDGDGYGDLNSGQYACYPPSGYVENSDDCDDGNLEINPSTVWYKDLDGDYYSDGTYVTQCEQPNGYAIANSVVTEGDCDDLNSTIHPENTEICDGLDNDCDGETDEGLLTTYYRDADGDGYGDPSNSQNFCSIEAGYVENSDDCEDSNESRNPNTVWFKDNDGDGYGDGTTISQCNNEPGYYLPTSLIETNSDCDDNSAFINPGVEEICDGVDNDCDGQTDEGVTFIYYHDEDGDGYGDPSNPSEQCYLDGNLVEDNTDCDDNNSHINPITDWYKDSDNDGYSDGTTTTQCDRPSGFYFAGELAQTDGDCDDDNSAINPAALEECDGVDNDCDGQTDEGVTLTYYHDEDGDGYGDPSNPSEQCYLEGNLVDDNTDCDDNNFEINPITDWYRDIDGDGFSDGGMVTQCERPSGFYYANELYQTDGDCDDNNSEINPAASEECDGVDNDCDGLIDEGLLTIFYVDSDNDGYGNPENGEEFCFLPPGYTNNPDDCDDNNPDINPNSVWYKDADGDGYSDGISVTQCEGPENYFLPASLTDITGDCDDNANKFNPTSLWYKDNDGDGFGDGNSLTQCEQPVGYTFSTDMIDNNGDCDDNDANVNFLQSEVCDGIDNNCDGNIDEGVTFTYYRDMDGDGYGDSGDLTEACSAPSGYVDNGLDCNDGDAELNPYTVWYKDFDGDLYSDGGTLTQCNQPEGYYAYNYLAALDGDCDDSNNLIHPGNSETCDGIDNNCNGEIDEGVLYAYYLDNDGDGFGDPANPTYSCSPSSGYVDDNSDCNDSNPAINPNTVWYKDADNDGFSDGYTRNGECSPPLGFKLEIELNSLELDCDDENSELNPGITEICDGIDNNCDGTIDEGFEMTTYYQDLDGDGFGNGFVSIESCFQPEHYVLNGNDCIDSDATRNPDTRWYKDADQDGYSDGTEVTGCDPIPDYYAAISLFETDGDCDDTEYNLNPGKTETCDGIDNNCDGQIDEGLLTLFYLDTDGDGYGDPDHSTYLCNITGEYSWNNEDCDDSDSQINPNTEWYMDADGDHYPDDSERMVQCDQPGEGYVMSSTLYYFTIDCDDYDANIYPNAEELCDGIDNNCDGNVDEGLLNTYFADMDTDGFGDQENYVVACTMPGGYTNISGDCDDSDANIHPNTEWFKDEDGDLYGDDTSVRQCEAPDGSYHLATYFISTYQDCNDSDAAINPEAEEVCDDVDNNCDGNIDEGVSTMYYFDGDLDGFGDGAYSIQSCSPVDGYVTNNTDCDDNDNTNVPTTLWYQDLDEDGYSDGTTVAQCVQSLGLYAPEDLLGLDGDCDDNNSAIHPGATEICSNGIDEDCDGLIDENCVTTKLNNNYCDITISSISSFLSCRFLPEAQKYRYLVEDGLGFTGTYESSNTSTTFRMNMVSPNVSYSTTYTVKVAAMIDDEWIAYGPACSITTPAIPTPALLPEFCETSINKATTALGFSSVFGATSYSVELSNSALSYSQTVSTGSSTASFSLSSFSGLKNGASYVVRIAALTPAGLGEFGASCSITVDLNTQVDASYCNYNLDLLGRKLKCDGVSGASKYRYRLTGPGGYDQTWTSPDNSINFKMTNFDALAPLSPSTTYTISVAVEMNGGFGSYGQACTITTPTIPTTTLVAESCDKTITSPSAKIYYTTVQGADSYAVVLSSLSPLYSQTFNVSGPSNFFTLSSFTNLTNGATYSVRVAAVMGGVTADWGSPCSLTVDLRTNLTSTYCNFTLSSLSQKIRCTAIPGASNYRFRVTGPGGYDQTWVSTDNSVYFRMSSVHALAPLSPGTTYSVSIAVDMNGGTGSFGNVCSVTTPPLFRLDEEELSDTNTEMAAYPNPFSQAINIELGEEKIPAKVTLRDLSGRILFVTTTENQQLVIGEALSKGIYLLSIEKGELRKETKIIKE